MTTTRIVFTHKNGIAAVESPALKFWKEIEETAALCGVPMSPEQIAVACMGKGLARQVKAGGAAPLLCDEADIPADRTFRNAWERGGDVPVRVNMEKAREIAAKTIRGEQASLLAQVDAAANRVMASAAAEEAEALAEPDAGKRATAVAASAAKKAAALAPILAKARQLRDAPDDPRLAAAADPAALKAAMESVIAEMKA